MQFDHNRYIIRRLQAIRLMHYPTGGPMNSLERFRATMHFAPADRRPLWEWHYLEDTVTRWHSEGLPAAVYMPEGDRAPSAGSVGIGSYFGLDHGQPYCPGALAYVPVNTGMLPSFPMQYLEEDERVQTLIDEEGVTKQILKHITPAMPRFIEFPVKGREDFARMQARYDSASPARYPAPAVWNTFVQTAAARDYPLGLMFDGFFGRLRRWMGLEALLYTLHDDPWLFQAMCDFHTEFILATLQRALAEAPIDYVNIWEDMAFKTGPLMSPRLVRKYMLPGYRKIVDLLRGHGIDTIFVDCDGNLDLLIPIWLEAGINGVWPLEAAAGMDPVALRQRYGRDLLLVGGIDKRELSQGPEQVYAEVMKKVPCLIEQGGFIPTVDHSVPPDVPLANYVYFRQLLSELS
jgi:hypothetical protein